jgi:hypothetical protein
MTLGFDPWLHGRKDTERNGAAKNRQRAGQRSLRYLETSVFRHENDVS